MAQPTAHYTAGKPGPCQQATKKGICALMHCCCNDVTNAHAVHMHHSILLVPPCVVPARAEEACRTNKCEVCKNPHRSTCREHPMCVAFHVCVLSAKTLLHLLTKTTGLGGAAFAYAATSTCSL